MSAVAISRIDMRAKLSAICLAPAVLIFLSSNLVNVGNLAFNMIFSRLMGPEVFGVLALLLTIKLALLGVLGALQMSVSQMIAAATKAEENSVKLALSRLNRRLFWGALVLVFSVSVGLLSSGPIGSWLGSVPSHLLVMLLASVPFGASFSILRGYAFGRLDTKRIVVSANVEMGVRLLGALGAWGLGFGLEGVVAAICLSIVAGWVVLADVLPRRSDKVETRGVAKTLATGAAAFGFLQFAQVIAMDGDIFIAKAVLSASESGYIAVLSLFQRIQFFACFALAGVLLPGIVIAVRNNTGLVSAGLPIFGLFAGVSLATLLGASVAPDLMVRLLAGANYLDAAPGLVFAVASAVFFTMNYLIATFLVALDNKKGVVLVCFVTALQFGAMALGEPSTFLDLVFLKACFQAGGSVLLTAYGVYVLKSRNQ